MDFFKNPPVDPLNLFGQWFEEAKKSETAFPDAMTLATCDQNHQPHVRVVLLKAFDARGFVFYTNLESNKSREIQQNKRASLNFYWKSLQKQIRIEGECELVASDEADQYFATRPRVSQLGAWASEQSRPMPDAWALEKRIAEVTLKFHVGHVPRPDFWSGYRVQPHFMEFWHEKPFRLHERVSYQKQNGIWTPTRLYP